MKKKLGLALILAIVSSGVLAEWEMLGELEEATQYVDKSTIRRSGNIVKMWKLLDFETIQNWDGMRPFLSIKYLNEYNCKEETDRLVYFLAHSEKMGTGKIASTNKPLPDWRPIAPGSLAELSWKVACDVQ